MADLPIGTVTFLFTDIEGSTELLTTLGERYGQVLERHYELLRRAVTEHGGVEVGTEGDALFAVFPAATDALRAAIDAQQALQSEDWPASVAVRVRMGIHTGAGIAGGDNYVGIDVHRASRIASAANGGQVLVSDSTRALSAQGLPVGVSLRDLGSHRLKGLPAPEKIFQLDVDGLPSDFPALRSLDARPNNLPTALTSFVGRETQIAEIMERLRSTRLLTMTGPGGTGKTRLSIRVAEEVIADYEHGCWFVELDVLRDPDLVPPTIAAALGVRIPADKPPMDALESWLAEKRLLLVLDNFEQVPAAAEHVTRLLAAAPGVRVLATSRVPLHVYGEQEYPVPPLASASELRAAGTANLEALSHYEAVRLFIERAVAIQPDFAVTNANAPAVAEICARLDGLPLAIELAAARIKLLSPEQMLARLEQNLSLLTSAARDLPERQRTLRGAIDWSHDLLTDPERRLFARLSVFRGGFTLEEAEEICVAQDAEIDSLDGISSLVDNSLVHVETSAAENRFRMLETIREYAREKLSQSTEQEAVTRRHGVFFFALAREAGRQLMSAESVSSLERLKVEQDNLRAAFSRAPEIGMLDEALIAAGTMWRFWHLRGEFVEGRAILEGLLDAPGADPSARAEALTGAGGIAYWQTDYAAMARHYAAAREIYEQTEDKARLAEAVYNEAFVGMATGDTAGNQAMIERAIALYREVGDEMSAAGAEMYLGITYIATGDVGSALPLTEKAVAAFRAADARWMLADALVGLAYEQSGVGDWPAAHASLRESIDIFTELENEPGLELALEAAAGFAAYTGTGELAARLVGKADQMRERMGGGPPMTVMGIDDIRRTARDALGAPRFDELHAEGMQLSTAEAVKLAVEFEVPAGTPPISIWNPSAL